MSNDRSFVTWTKQDNGVATLVVNNPPMNVMSASVAAELQECCAELGADPSVVVVVVTGGGDRAFMAGADIRGFPDMMGKVGAAKTFSEQLHAALDALAFLPKPTIAAIQGYALGGGLELALACDIRIAAENTQLGVPEIKLGLFPGAGGTQRLPRLIGEAKAKEMMFTGDPISANEALRIGLVNQVVSAGQALEVAYKMAGTIASRTLASLTLIKGTVDAGIQMTLNEGLRLENEAFDKVFQTEDVKEGVDAFLNKRQPKFQHR